MKKKFELTKVFTGSYFIALFGVLGVFLYWQYSTIKEFHTIELQNYFKQTNKIVNVLIEKEKSEIREIVLSHIDYYSKKNQKKKTDLTNIDFLFSTKNDKVINVNGYNLFVDVEKIAKILAKKFHNRNILEQIIKVDTDENTIYLVAHKEQIIDEKFGKVIGTLWGATILNENVSIVKEFKKDTGVADLAFLDTDNQIVASTLAQKKIKYLLNENLNDNIFNSEYGDLIVSKQSLTNYEKLKVVFIIDNKKYTNLLHQFQNKAVVAVIILAVFGILLYYIIRVKFIDKLSKLRFFIQNTLQNKNTHYESSSIVELDTIASEFEHLFTEFRHYQDTLEETVIEKTNENLKQMEILQQQSKLAQMGEMIGAIAHQWRQPLNVITTGIQNLKYDYKDGKLNDEEFIKNFISENKKTIKFMSNTIDDFRCFFRTDKEKIDFKVKETIQSVLAMQSSQLKSHKIVVELLGDEFIYYGLQSEFQQVILNILNNAKDALIENDIENKLLTISISPNKVTIQDNAGGIPDEILPRVFEPYFTTKEQGKGTGIGLYISKLIIESNMSSLLEVENNNDGALFTIKFLDEESKELSE